MTFLLQVHKFEPPMIRRHSAENIKVQVIRVYFYRLQQYLRESNVFTGVRHSFCSRGGVSQYVMRWGISPGGVCPGGGLSAKGGRGYLPYTPRDGHWCGSTYPTQWRIQDFPEGGGVNPPGGAWTRQIFPKTAWNRKNLDAQGGACVPHAPP